MAKHFSFVAIDVEPISQNNRTATMVNNMGITLVRWHDQKYITNRGGASSMIKTSLDPLTAKIFYIHRVADKKDADNISKPMWDALNKRAYLDDRQVKYLETLKIHLSTSDLHELDVSMMDDDDFDELVDFIGNPAKERFIYIEISELECKNVRFT